jgi:hypothetical protein
MPLVSPHACGGETGDTARRTGSAIASPPGSEDPDGSGFLFPPPRRPLSPRPSGPPSRTTTSAPSPRRVRHVPAGRPLTCDHRGPQTRVTARQHFSTHPAREPHTLKRNVSGPTLTCSGAPIMALSRHSGVEEGWPPTGVYGCPADCLRTGPTGHGSEKRGARDAFSETPRVSDRHPCPCCGHRIWSICSWEDDDVQFRWLLSMRLALAGRTFARRPSPATARERQRRLSPYQPKRLDWVTAPTSI